MTNTLHSSRERRAETAARVSAPRRPAADSGSPPPPGSAAGAAVTRWLLAGVAFAAGLVGAAMVLAPGSTGRYFSWQLNPPALAAFVGAAYLASAIVFGAAAFARSWAAQRGLCASVLGLAAPTLVITAVHRDVFDFSRWQAVAWVVLFISSVTSFATLVRQRGRPARQSLEEPVLTVTARALLVALGVAYGAIAVALWTSPGAASDHGPLTAGPLGLRFVGSWAAFLGLCALYAARHPRWVEARFPVVALIVFPLAVLIAAVAHRDELRHGVPAVAFTTTLAALGAGGLSVRWAGRTVKVPPTRGGAVR